METAALLLLLVAILALVLWSVRTNRAVAADLAGRPEREFQVAGLDKSEVVGSHAVWGTTPWRNRRLRRRLDDAAAKIARFEGEPPASRADRRPRE
ncbi:hypothetical protein [Nocardioides sp.]|uniref:hypothetical protein n=1 Tax=Nocardioides sp. TaxID=35761 RepID=UPI003784D51D